VRIRKLVQRAAVCALVFMMLGIANLSSGGIITSADYTYSWSEWFTSAHPSSGLSYGSPQLIGADMLEFASGLNFSSLALGPNSVDFVDGKMVLDITAQPGQGIKGLNINERGAYTFGPGPGAPVALAQVQFLGATLNITSIDNVPVTTLADIPLTMNFATPAPTENTSKTITQGTAGVGDHGNWTGSLSIDNIYALLPSDYKDKKITGAKLIFDNQLGTVAGASAWSFIDKKDLKIGVTPLVQTPEPSTLALLGMGALLFVFLPKRRKNA
jgi:hypothetical protein